MSKEKCLVILTVLFCCLTITASAGARSWYPLTGGLVTGLRGPSPYDLLEARTEGANGEAFILYRNRTSSSVSTPMTKSGFFVLDIEEAKIIEGITFQNQFNRTGSTAIGAVAIHVAENEGAANFDPISRNSYSKLLYRGLVEPNDSTAGAVRNQIKIPQTKRRYFLIEILSTNKFRGSIDNPEYSVGEVWFGDIFVNDK